MEHLQRQFVALDVVRLTLEEIYNGCEKVVEVVSSESCSQCKNSKRDTDCSNCGFQLVYTAFPKGTNMGVSNFKCKNGGTVTAEICQIPHIHYQRHDSNLFATCELTFKEALYGFKKYLPALNGQPILIQPKVGKVISDEEILVVRNNGMPNNSSYGNLYIKFAVQTPKQLERNLLKNMSKVLTREHFAVASI